MLQLRQSTFAQGVWGLTYANKTREAQVLPSAGSSMKYLPIEIGEHERDIKHTTIFHIYLIVDDMTSPSDLSFDFI